jgi:dienelactone hydrolase
VLIGPSDVNTITTTLKSANKRFEVQMYPNVGHSFFRTTGNSSSTREAADAWDRVQAFFGKYLK